VCVWPRARDRKITSERGTIAEGFEVRGIGLVLIAAVIDSGTVRFLATTALVWAGPCECRQMCVTGYHTDTISRLGQETVILITATMIIATIKAGWIWYVMITATIITRVWGGSCAWKQICVAGHNDT
jgi:hypothetical protein